eukprot:695205-Karenia_brevis.AAC.1
MVGSPNLVTGEPDFLGTITAQTPVAWTTAPKYQWRHGADAYAAPHIRQFVLQPSIQGAGMKEGDALRLYTSKSKKTSLYYAWPREFPYMRRNRGFFFFWSAGHHGLQDVSDRYGRSIK